MTSIFQQEVNKGERFQFGENWQQFLSILNDERIAEAEKSLKEMLEVEDLQGKTFLDIGSGSGLFSLAARRLGAKVYSFDYDPHSVACTQELKSFYCANDPNWTIGSGSILDENYLRSLGEFDIVYSWGVLHHTGAMWQALANTDLLVKNQGQLFIAIYNDQGGASRRWAKLKQFYNQSPKLIQILLIIGVGLYWESRSALIRLLRWQNPWPFKYWAEKKKSRGMSVWHDLVDWVGGYPFEVAKPEEIFDFYRDRNYMLRKLKTCGSGHGCNEFVLIKQQATY